MPSFSSSLTSLEFIIKFMPQYTTFVMQQGTKIICWEKGVMRVHMLKSSSCLNIICYVPWFSSSLSTWEASHENDLWLSAHLYSCTFPLTNLIEVWCGDHGAPYSCFRQTWSNEQFLETTVSAWLTLEVNDWIRYLDTNFVLLIKTAYYSEYFLSSAIEMTWTS